MSKRDCGSLSWARYHIVNICDHSVAFCKVQHIQRPLPVDANDWTLERAIGFAVTQVMFQSNVWVAAKVARARQVRSSTATCTAMFRNQIVAAEIKRSSELASPMYGHT